MKIIVTYLSSTSPILYQSPKLGCISDARVTRKVRMLLIELLVLLVYIAGTKWSTCIWTDTLLGRQLSQSLASLVCLVLISVTLAYSRPLFKTDMHSWSIPQQTGTYKSCLCCESHLKIYQVYHLSLTLHQLLVELSCNVLLPFYRHNKGVIYFA